MTKPVRMLNKTVEWRMYRVDVWCWHCRKGRPHVWWWGSGNFHCSTCFTPLMILPEDYV